MRGAVRVLAMLVFGGGVIALQSCDVLEAPAPGVCGNLIVEPEAGEACDEPFTAPGQTEIKAADCGAPGSVAACQHLCDLADAPGFPCPEHYTCGADGVCRTPSLVFEKRGGYSASNLHQLVAGDFNSDGRDDLVSVSAEVQLRTFDESLAVATTYRDPNLLMGPNDYALAARFGPAEQPTLVLSYGKDTLNGQGVEAGVFQLLRGLEGGTLRAAFVPRYDGFPADALLSSGVLSVFHGMTLEYLRPSSEPESVSFELPKASSLIVGEPAVDFYGACIELIAAIAYEGDGFAHLFTFREEPYVGCPDPILDREVHLPVDLPVSAVTFARLDEDFLPDLLITADDGEGGLTFPVYAWTDGSFRSAPDGDPSAVTNQAADVALVPGFLAMGDANGDGSLDFVTADGKLFISNDFSGCVIEEGCEDASLCFDGYICRQLQKESSPPPSWRAAAIGDIDGIGQPDLIASERDHAVLDVYSDFTYSASTSLVVQTEQQVEQLLLTRIDNDDSLLDVSLIERPTGGGAIWSVASGRAFSEPAAPVELERFRDIRGMSTFGSSTVLLVSTLDIEEPDTTMVGFYDAGHWPPIDPGVGAPSLSTLVLGAEGTSYEIVVLAEGSETSPNDKLLLFPNRGLDAPYFGKAFAENHPYLEMPAGLAGIESWLALPFDDNGDGIDDVVLLGPDEDTGAGRVLVAHLTGPFGGPFELVFDEGARPVSVPLGSETPYQRGRAVALDSDGDALSDVVLALTPEASPRLVEFRPGQLASPRLLSIIDPEANSPPVLLTTMKMGPGESDVLVVLDSYGVVYFYRYGKEFGSENPCPGAGAGELGRCLNFIEVALPGKGTSLATGDFDGDGIQDLAVGNDSAVSLFHGGHYLQAPGSLANNTSAP